MRLRTARERAGLTQGQVGEYEGLGKQYLSKLELGINSPPTWELLRRLARRYHTSTDYLLGLIDDPRQPENKTLPEGGSALLEYLAGMSPRGRQSLLALSATLAELDQWWREREAATRMAISLDEPGGLESLVAMIHQFTTQFESREAALHYLTALFAGLDNSHPPSDIGIE